MMEELPPILSDTIVHLVHIGALEEVEVRWLGEVVISRSSNLDVLSSVFVNWAAFKMGLGYVSCPTYGRHGHLEQH